ncbi:MAG: cell division protein SepF [Acidimicrobiia bacterium]|nr:cell division protein SepF [Acidimicrobiia bacterium]
MSSMLRKAMMYLGFGPDEEYDDEYDVAPERPVRGGRVGYSPDPYEGGTVRPMPVRAGRQGEGRDASREMAFEPSRERERPPEQETPSITTRPRGGSAVRTVPATPNAKPHTVTPASFNDAQDVGDRFKEGLPVIVNLQDVDSDLKRRLIDFASGLCYALDGKVERVANGVYLLSPANVQVSDEDRRRMSGRGDG